MSAVWRWWRLAAVLLVCLAALGCGAGGGQGDEQASEATSASDESESAEAPGAPQAGGEAGAPGAPDAPGGGGGGEGERTGGARGAPLEMPTFSQHGAELGDEGDGGALDSIKAQIAAEACGGELCVTVKVEPEGADLDTCRFSRTRPPEGGTMHRDDTVYLICTPQPTVPPESPAPSPAPSGSP